MISSSVLLLPFFPSKAYASSFPNTISGSTPRLYKARYASVLPLTEVIYPLESPFIAAKTHVPEDKLFIQVVI